MELQPEQYHFNEYYATFTGLPDSELIGLPSQKILSLWLEYEDHIERKDKLGLLKKISIFFRFNRSAEPILHHKKGRAFGRKSKTGNRAGKLFF